MFLSQAAASPYASRVDAVVPFVQHLTKSIGNRTILGLRIGTTGCGVGVADCHISFGTSLRPYEQ